MVCTRRRAFVHSARARARFTAARRARETANESPRCPPRVRRHGAARAASRNRSPWASVSGGPSVQRARLIRPPARALRPADATARAHPRPRRHSMSAAAASRSDPARDCEIRGRGRQIWDGAACAARASATRSTRRDCCRRPGAPDRAPRRRRLHRAMSSVHARARFALPVVADAVFSARRPADATARTAASWRRTSPTAPGERVGARPRADAVGVTASLPRANALAPRADADAASSSTTAPLTRWCVSTAAARRSRANPRALRHRHEPAHLRQRPGAAQAVVRAQPLYGLAHLHVGRDGRQVRRRRRLRRQRDALRARQRLLPPAVGARLSRRDRDRRMVCETTIKSVG